jgi:hypothetical protein
MDTNGSYTRQTPRRRRDTQVDSPSRAIEGYVRLKMSLPPESSMRNVRNIW